jgi:uncharacterized protein (DUF2267 family)
MKADSSKKTIKNTAQLLQLIMEKAGLSGSQSAEDLLSMVISTLKAHSKTAEDDRQPIEIPGIGTLNASFNHKNLLQNLKEVQKMLASRTSPRQPEPVSHENSRQSQPLEPQEQPPSTNPDLDTREDFITSIKSAFAKGTKPLKKAYFQLRDIEEDLKGADREEPVTLAAIGTLTRTYWESNDIADTISAIKDTLGTIPLSKTAEETVPLTEDQLRERVKAFTEWTKSSKDLDPFTIIDHLPKLIRDGPGAPRAWETVMSRTAANLRNSKEANTTNAANTLEALVEALARLKTESPDAWTSEVKSLYHLRRSNRDWTGLASRFRDFQSKKIETSDVSTGVHEYIRDAKKIGVDPNSHYGILVFLDRIKWPDNKAGASSFTLWLVKKAQEEAVDSSADADSLLHFFNLGDNIIKVATEVQQYFDTISAIAGASAAPATSHTTPAPTPAAQQPPQRLAAMGVSLSEQQEAQDKLLMAALQTTRPHGFAPKRDHPRAPRPSVASTSDESGNGKRKFHSGPSSGGPDQDNKRVRYCWKCSKNSKNVGGGNIEHPDGVHVFE